MDFVTTVIIIFVTALTNALIFGIFIHYYQKKTESMFAKELEQFKVQLQYSNFEEQTKFAQLHTKRVEVLETLFQKFDTLTELLHWWTLEVSSESPMELKLNADNNHKHYVDVSEKLKDFFDYYTARRIFLTDNLSNEIMEFYTEARFVIRVVRAFALGEKSLSFMDAYDIARIDEKVFDAKKLDIGNPNTIFELRRLLDNLIQRFQKLYKSVAHNKE